MKKKLKVGIIGGSGLYDIEGLKKKKEVSIKTPFGKPSDKYTIFEFDGKEVIFLPRHGKHHTILPSKLNFRANIYGFKSLGVDKIISISACGSLKEEYKPLDFVVVDQFIDRTNQARPYTFFDKDLVVHISFAHPVCKNLADSLYRAATKAKVKVHKKGTYINMEGPQFSTLAESNLYRSWGADIIGMTNMAEAKLAREAEICYASIAAITDYDCWHPDHDSVTVEMIISNLIKNVENSKRLIKEFLLSIDETSDCNCQEALKYAIVTNSKFIPKTTKEKLNLLIGKYIK